MPREIMKDNTNPFSLFYPEYRTREFYIDNEDQIKFGVTIVRYMNGKTRCIINGKSKEGKYILDDASGTVLAIRLKTFEELKEDCVIVKFLDIEETMKQPGKPCTIEAINDFSFTRPEGQYNYGTLYLRHKTNKADIMKFECKHLAETKWHGPGNVEYVHHNDSFVSCDKGEDILMLNSVIENEYEMVEPIFGDYKGE